MNNIPKNLKDLRVKKDWTQQQLADRLYVTRQCISRWEQGKTLPDVLTMERIAEVLECELNDLIDDNSIKSITIDQAVLSQKKSIYLWISLMISTLAIVGVILLLTVFRPIPQEQNPAVELRYGYIDVIDADHRVLTIRPYVETQESYQIAYDEDTPQLFDPHYNPISFADLTVGDKVELEYDFDSKVLGRLTVIDTPIDEELYGVYVSATGLEYADALAVKNDLQVEYVEELSGGTHVRFANLPIQTVSIGDFFLEKTYELTVWVNPLLVTEDIVIGVMTSNGLRSEYVVNLEDVVQDFVISGDCLFTSTDEDWIDNFHVTYLVHIEWAFSFTSIDIFEYDPSNQLLQETTIHNLSELRAFTANSEALRCVFKVHTELTNGDVTWEEHHAYELFLGEDITLLISNPLGVVAEDTWTYQ